MSTRNWTTDSFNAEACHVILVTYIHNLGRNKDAIVIIFLVYIV